MLSVEVQKATGLKDTQTFGAQDPYLKVSLLSDAVPSAYRDPMLIFLEGDRRAPSRYRARLQASAKEVGD